MAKTTLKLLEPGEGNPLVLADDGYTSVTSGGDLTWTKIGGHWTAVVPPGQFKRVTVTITHPDDIGQSDERSDK